MYVIHIILFSMIKFTHILKALLCSILLVLASPAFAQIMTVGIGLGMHQAERLETRFFSNQQLDAEGNFQFVNGFDPVHVKGRGGGFSMTTNISFLGWILNNMWDDLGRGFYVGDYIETGGGFGSFRTRENDVKLDSEFLIWYTLNLGFQAGYKIPNLGDLASIEARWYINGTFNTIRSAQLSGLSSIHDDFKNIGLTGRYGSYCLRFDYGYADISSGVNEIEVEARRLSLGGYWMFDKSKEYSSSSFNSAIGVRYESFYNYFQGAGGSFNGRNNAIFIELTIIKF